MRIMVTGGAGFIGSALVRRLIDASNHDVINVDKLTYAGNRASLQSVEDHPRYRFYQMDICQHDELLALFRRYEPDAVMHLAAESHVDRSIHAPDAFMHSNIMGTFSLLEATREYLSGVNIKQRSAFRFLQVSTDEVYGDLGADDAAFRESSPYAPSSPYAASKASADHLATAWHRTYQIPVITSHCSNNFGPYQFPEKLIPVVITAALRGDKIPVYGDGNQARDWIHVDDHVDALLQLLQHGRVGESYLIGARNEQKNINVVNSICALLNTLAPAERYCQNSSVVDYTALIEHVADRAGHDLRYAVDPEKITRELSWVPRKDFQSGLRETVQWYLDNKDWCVQ